METVLRWAVLAAIFAAGGWGGYALSRPGAEGRPAPSAAPLPGPAGDPALPSGTATPASGGPSPALLGDLAGTAPRAPPCGSPSPT